LLAVSGITADNRTAASVVPEASNLVRVLN